MHWAQIRAKVHAPSEPKSQVLLQRLGKKPGKVPQFLHLSNKTVCPILTFPTCSENDTNKRSKTVFSPLGAGRQTCNQRWADTAARKHNEFTTGLLDSSHFWQCSCCLPGWRPLRSYSAPAKTFTCTCFSFKHPAKDVSKMDGSAILLHVGYRQPSP